MSKANVVLGVTASIAIYKSLEVISLLKKKDFTVRVALSREAKELISPIVYKALTNNDVYCDVMEELNLESTSVTHVALSEWADIFAVVPATANTISKIANGIADDPVSLIALATKAHKIIAPAMNTSMYLNPIIQKNLNILRSNGFEVVEPVEGNLACNTKGIGHIARCEDIVQVIESTLFDKSLKGKTVIVSAGPTIEPIDPVRYLTNRSSGKMGFAIARVAKYMGARAILISGPTCLQTPYGVEKIGIESALDMFEVLKENIEAINDEIILVMAAAVADFKPRHYEYRKIKKLKGKGFSLELEQNPDVTLEISRFAKRLGKNLRIVGFAAETDDLLENAKRKIYNKGLEFIVANDVSRDDIGFGSDENEITIVYPNGKAVKIPKSAKDIIAYEILRRFI